jgi:arylformamidase
MHHPMSLVDKVVDLTHRISSDMPVYPGTEQPRIVESCTVARHGFLEKQITMFSHIGTHIDAPAHLLENGLTLDRLPVSHFLGRAFVYHYTGDEKTIHPGDIEPFAEDIARADYLLIATGWDSYWGTDQYFINYPTLDPDAANWLLQFTLKGIGLDVISADPIDCTTLHVHRIVLGQGMVIVENLKNLCKLPSETCTFYCLPLLLPEADGSPVRAIAIF